MTEVVSELNKLSERSRTILRRIVESYLETGEPVGSRTISRRLGMSLSPATIRNVMADLEEAGLLFAPHTSAGRLPTDVGLRLFVHGLLEVGGLCPQVVDRRSRCRVDGNGSEQSADDAQQEQDSHCDPRAAAGQGRRLRHQSKRGESRIRRGPYVV